MKRKSLFTICAIALMLVLSLSVLAACNKNKHNFSGEWKNDEQYHWHECVTKKHMDVADKADHTFDAGVVTKDPTEAEEGVKTFTCTVCGYQKTEAVPKLGHTFDMNKWKYDDENHWHPATSGHADEKKDLGAHVWNEGVVTKEPTEAEEGVKTYTCTTCGKTKTATIGRLDHEHTFNMEAWTFDDENHWHPATCGHTDEKKGFEAHNWNAGVVTTEPNYGVEGEKTFTCTVCKTTRTEPIAALAAKDNEIVLKEGKTLGKEYDREAISITKEDFVIEGNREPAFMFKVKGADDNTYAATAPTNVGEYTVKVSVAATAEWKAASNTFDFAIAKADISGFEISNAAAFEKGFYVGATNIPEPTTDYVEIGTGYGERTIVWEKQLEGGVWSRDLTKEEVMQSKTGTFRVRIKYAEGDNYNFGATQFVSFTLNVKPRTLTVNSFAGKTYDGKPMANFTFNSLVKKFGATSHDGVQNFTSGLESGEKYVEFRRKGEVLWTKVTGTYIPKNAAEYEYRVGVTATDEWAAVVSEVKTFTIKPYEFVLELGYGQNQNNPSYDEGKTFFLRIFYKANGKELIEGQTIELWLDNEKAGFKTEKRNNVYYFIPDQKKQVTPDCFFLKITNITNPVMENYKIVTKSPSVTTVEITVVEKLTTGKSTTGKIQALNETEKWIRATVEKGSFKVGQTVEVYNSAGVKLGEATITQIKVKGTISASGFAIPSDGLVQITLDKVFSGMVYGKLVEK